MVKLGSRSLRLCNAVGVNPEYDAPPLPAQTAPFQSLNAPQVAQASACVLAFRTPLYGPPSEASRSSPLVAQPPPPHPAYFAG